MVIDSQAALKAGFREMHLSACNEAFASGMGEAAGPLPMLLSVRSLSGYWNSARRSLLHRISLSSDYAGRADVRNQHVFLTHDQGRRVQTGQLEAVTVCNCVRGTGLDAVSAEDAPVVVDVVDLGVDRKSTRLNS